MNTAELTALLNEDRTAKRTTRLLANITRRAGTLLADGYRIKEEVGFWFVYGPQGNDYMVWTGSPKTGEYCNCPCFKEHSTCKHYLAVKANINAQEAAYDAQAERQEEASTYFAEAAAAY